MQLSVITSKLSTVKLLHRTKAGDCSIGASQIRRASVSLIPLGVGHIRSGCNGPGGAVTVGGAVVSLAVIIAFSDSGMLDIINNNSTEGSFGQQSKTVIRGSTNN